MSDAAIPAGPSVVETDVSVPAAAPAALPVDVVERGTFAGLPIATIILGAVVLALAMLSVWQTREILALRSHRTVAVSLLSLRRDFIAAEASGGGSPEAAVVRTRLYLAATEAALRELREKGNTVLVAEAVAGNSVPDVTPAVKADIDAKLKAVQVSIALNGRN